MSMKGLLFDLNNTLYDVAGTRRQAESVAFEYLHTISGAEIKYVRELNERIVSEMVGTSEQVFKTPGDYLRARFSELLSRLNVRDQAMLDVIIDTYQNSRRHIPMKDAYSVLRTLSKRRYTLGLVTNGFSDIQRDVISQLGFDEYFGNNVFISQEAGLFKPDEKLFEYAIDRIGISPEQCAMVGDDLELDIEPAKKLGMFTVLLDVEWTKIGIKPDSRIRELKELLELFP